MKSRKNYSVDEVIRSLTSKKGCVITKEQPITKEIDVPQHPNKAAAKINYKAFLDKNMQEVQVLVAMDGEEVAHNIMFNRFKKENPELFTVKMVKKTITVQPPFTVNIQHANLLGNGSWGKIDFLTNHCGFTIMK